MGRISTDWLLALIGGLLLALMIQYNSFVARQSTPMFSSWLAHGIGSIASLFFVLLFVKASGIKRQTKQDMNKIPLWAYLGGIPGAFTVLFAGITVNSQLGLSGSIAFMLLGQVLFSIAVDCFGLFGLPKRRLVLLDFFVIFCILAGSWMITFFRPL